MTTISAVAERPNILLICVDHWPGNLLGAAGHSCIMTPTLDQLAANGVRFTNAYSATPVCIAARRALMTGTSARTHGDRGFNETLPMPNSPTLAGTLRSAGYQTYAVGKLHVYPQRNRIGFDDVTLNEEGRHHLEGKADDYELFLANQGFAGQEYTHGMANTDYLARPWHLPEHLHPTNWAAHEMCRTIYRRDPTRPAFWYLSFAAPHPPLVPPAVYWEMYRDHAIPEAILGDWSTPFDKLPWALQDRHNRWYASLRYPNGRIGLTDAELRLARQAFYAQCTHIDHQIRLVIGTLREEGVLDNTIIAFTSDHGDMLGDHGFYAKGLLYEAAANIPLILVPTADYPVLGHHQIDTRLIELRDIMPTLLEMAGVPIPAAVEGISVIGNGRRAVLYGEQDDGPTATRMVRDDRYKLIYYATGNCFQLFDLHEDPGEMTNLATSADHAEILRQLTKLLIAELYGDDLAWLEDDRLVGLPSRIYEPRPNRGLTAQRGRRFV